MLHGQAIIGGFRKPKVDKSVKNSIEVSAQFDFKGCSFRPQLVLDLDALLERRMDMPDLHQMLATEHGIGLYSYEYEVLESTPLSFGNPTGLAAAFLDGDQFDYAGFRERWLEEQQLQRLQVIARRHLGVEDLSAEPALRAALLEAYRLGCQG